MNYWPTIRTERISKRLVASEIRKALSVCPMMNYFSRKFGLAINVLGRWAVAERRIAPRITSWEPENVSALS